MSKKNKPPVKLPRFNENVLAILRHWRTKNEITSVLYSVDEDDCCWRTADDGSELSHDWDVISWEYLTDVERRHNV
jgi:hypothetical protein